MYMLWKEIASAIVTEREFFRVSAFDIFFYFFVNVLFKTLFLICLWFVACPQVLQGNHNPYTEEKRELSPPIWASRLRFLPYSYHRRTVCMRVELYGCPWAGGVVAYAMPQGDKRGASWEFFDTSYDGPWDPQPHGGLGQLTDTIFGADNFKMSYYEADKGTARHGAQCRKHIVQLYQKYHCEKNS